ncbi:MAG: ABC transporter ATP-binding protein [Deltaproteobacteria bacterium]|jgi:ABC-2 type transport system ATP-binding protein|nr:ABC transporter ATP-binding protein [Deltaproteobacteria bacterium]MBT6434638.1 ABC transporter ATP-binding protein [Deltaproteobacteria bacterium]MBT6491469.1 ABC transporter ATP-binding protein [Deltaproteobacteria bacterium]
MFLQATSLVKNYGDHPALRGLDLAVDKGEVFCLLGANGAGKTTTIQLFLGFIEPTSGSAKIKGLEVSQYPLETKKFLAYIPENVMLYKNLSGIENLEYFTTLAGASDTNEEYLRATLKRAGLPTDFVDRPVGTYSKGMRQKVGIAMAIARKAELLLLDEPTSGLDPKASNEFSELVCSLRDDGVAVLMATHDLFRSREIATRIGIMKQGELVSQFAAQDVSHNDLERIYLEHMHD